MSTNTAPAVSVHAPIVRNAPEAMRLALCTERARATIAAGYSYCYDEDLQSVMVCKPGRLAFQYLIDTSKPVYECDCPAYGKDWQYYCKHTLAFTLLLQAEQEEEAKDAALMEAHKEEIAELGKPCHYSVSSLARQLGL